MSDNYVRYLSWIPAEKLLQRNPSTICTCPCHTIGGKLCLPPCCCKDNWKGKPELWAKPWDESPLGTP